MYIHNWHIKKSKIIRYTGVFDSTPVYYYIKTIIIFVKTELVTQTTKRNTLIKEIRHIAEHHIQFILIISISVGTLLHLPELISYIEQPEALSLFGYIRGEDLLSEVLFTIFSLVSLFLFNTYLLKTFTPDKITRWRYIIVIVLCMLLLSHALGQGFFYLHTHFHVPAINTQIHHYLHPVRNLVIGIIVVGSCYIIELIHQKQKVQVENEKLYSENILNQYEALKNQLNPHMLFNSLNTLQSLVREDKHIAISYIKELSTVLRYTLHDNENKSVTLKEEMNFVQAYIYLLKMRFEDNLSFQIEIDESVMNEYLPPMSLQLLVENAVKHNEISNRKPLMISVALTTDHYICVSNPIQAKLSTEAGTGVGLANLSKRYQLLYNKEILISADENTFEVKLPLINETGYKQTML